MKKIYFTLSLLTATVLFSQTSIIYSENFGIPATAPISLAAYTNYENSSPVTYTGTADIRNTSPSTGYAGASGDGCVFVAGVAAPSRFIIIEGINTQNFTNLALSFGHYKTTNAATNELTVEVSPDGTNWSPLTYTRASGSSTWALINPAGAIPSATNLRVRFTNTTAAAGFRIDDVKLTGTATNLAVQSSSKQNFDIFPTLVSEGIIHITSSKNSMKSVKIFDMSSKLMMSIQTQKEVNVSSLEKGNYIINIEEDGVSTSKKIIIK